MDDPGAVPGDALENIAFLSRSENRVQVLEALTAGPRTRRELQETTGTTRTTLGRILGELEERGWAERTTDGDYVTTPVGERIAEEFRPFLGAMETIRDLGEAVAWLPPDELSISLRHFSDATVRRPEPNEPIEAGRHLAEALHDAATLDALTFIAPPLTVGTAIRDGVLSERLTVDVVMTGELIDYLRNHPERPPPWRDCIEAGASAYRYRGHIPCNLFVVDETVFILKGRSERGNVGTVIESRNPVVQSWAHELLEAYREDADQVDAEAFSQGGSG